jgi:RNA polymerase sigma-70 factor (ECF subfamily)
MDPLEVPINELAKACAHSCDAEEWQELLRRSQPLVLLVAGRVTRLWMGASVPTMVDDIAQEVFLKLCERERRVLREFEPRHGDSFHALLRMVTVSVASDYFRRLHSIKRGGSSPTAVLRDEPAPRRAERSNQTDALNQSVLRLQLDKMLMNAPETISARDRSLFWLYYLQGLTAGEIAELPSLGLSSKGVESVIRRVGNWLREEIKRLSP